MDPLSIVTSVLSAVLTIKTWADNTKKKGQAVTNFSATINLVHLTLSPLEDPTVSQCLQPSVIASLLSIGEVLSRIKDHLSLWQDRRLRPDKLWGIVSPGGVINDLRDDAQLLSQHLLSISLALHVSTFLEGQSRMKSPPPEPSVLDRVKNVQLRGFWRDMIGERVSRNYTEDGVKIHNFRQVSYTSRSEFCKAITTWLKEDLSPSLLDALLLRLDEFGVGGVTLSSINQFVGEKTLSDAIRQLQQKGRRVAATAARPRANMVIAQTHCLDANGQYDSRPWLIWIDDNPNNISEYFSFAQCKGICVFHFFSTAFAKAWIDSNEGLIWYKCPASLVSSRYSQTNFTIRRTAISSASSLIMLDGKTKRSLALA